jgi:hypothetical protein
MIKQMNPFRLDEEMFELIRKARRIAIDAGLNFVYSD